MLKFLSARRFNYIDIIAVSFLVSAINTWGFIGFFYIFPFYAICTIISLHLEDKYKDAR